MGPKIPVAHDCKNPKKNAYFEEGMDHHHLVYFLV
jgi:hypothetical protein